MNDRLNNQNEPVCRFGPGGDFISAWPKDQAASLKPEQNRLAKLLNTINEIINAALGSEFDNATNITTGFIPQPNRILYHEEKLKYDVKNSKPDNQTYSAPVAVTKSASSLPGESLLFPDDCRISLRTKHKPKHRIRAHRRTAKKGSAIEVPGQGSLFNDNFKSAKTA